MKVLIVDDEANARENLIRRLRKLYPEIVVFEEASSVEMAKRHLVKQAFDIVFLDIEMPGEDGFELLRSYEKVPFAIIFVTAYNEYAVKAFEFLAQGYVLKPVDNQLLKRVVDNIIENKLSSKDQSILKKLDSLINNTDRGRLGIPVEKGVDIIEKSEILYLEASEGYSIIYLANKAKVVSSKRLPFFEDHLEGYRFIRIHRKYIVNFDFVKRFNKVGEIILVNNEVLPVSKAGRALVKDILP